MSTRPAIRWPAVCVVAAAVVLFADARPASAGCGDYVHVRTKQTTDAPAPPADSPCAHGRCERLPLSPATPEPTDLSGDSPRDAVLTITVSDLTPLQHGYTDAEAGEPSHVPSVPFHPPRA